MLTGGALSNNTGSGDVPAVVMFSTDGRADAHAVIKTDAGADTGADAGTDAGTDDGDARADAGTLRKSDARALATTDNRSALLGTDASALLVGSLLERQAYG